MVLVNGADGIGTGYSTSIPNYNPRDIISNLRKNLQGQQMKDMNPWYAGFRGCICQSKEEGKADVSGIIEMTGERTACITELPIRKWTQDYREFLEDLLPKNDRKRDGGKVLDEYSEHHTENTVHFELNLAQHVHVDAGRVGTLER